VRYLQHAMKADREAFAALIRATGLRVTTSRIQVLKALHAASAPLSHADVATQVESLGLDRTTVYRNLVDLAEVGILRRTDVEHTWRFELTDAAHGQNHDTEQHAHFVCKDCGKVACLPAGAVALKPGRGVPQALRRGDLEIQLRGVCDACH
jgi:Fur family ferric uptake transcriptional regulator